MGGFTPPQPSLTIARPAEHLRQEVQRLACVVVVAGADEARQGERVHRTDPHPFMAAAGD